jgi:hypothetical protein
VSNAPSRHPAACGVEFAAGATSAARRFPHPILGGVPMTRTRSGKTLTELLTMLAVLLGLGGMLAYSVQKVCAVGLAPDRAAGTAAVSVSTNSQHR